MILLFFSYIFLIMALLGTTLLVIYLVLLLCTMYSDHLAFLIGDKVQEITAIVQSRHAILKAAGWWVMWWILHHLSNT